MRKKFFFIIIALLFFYVYVTNIGQIPSKIYLLSGEKINIKTLYGITLKESRSEIKQTWQSENMKTTNLDVMLLGNIKVKEVTVTTYPKLKVIPTGNLIGLKLYTNGVLVIGTSEIKSINDVIEKPYEFSSIKEGDIILEISNQEIDSIKTLQNIVNNSDGKELELKYLRNNQIYTTKILPTKTGENEYRLGLWVRDSASGVGTMTFYEPDSKRFAALGHGISDGDTGELLNIEKGDLVNSKVVNIIKGRKGFPGEIKGSISNEETIGRVNLNTNFGIFGNIEDGFITYNNYSDGIEVALREEIKIGDATMLATLETGEVKEYNVKITNIDLSNNYDNKSFKLEVIDDGLKNKAGGIICGMSGAPIIQNNKLVGALTNVLVSDPTVGYGVFSDIMIKKMIE